MEFNLTFRKGSGKKSETLKFSTEHRTELLTEALVSTIQVYTLNFSLCLFRTAPATYGSSQARGQIRTVAASLHHSHGNSGSETCRQPTPQITAMPDP